MPINDPPSPSPALREREGPSLRDREGEGCSRHSPLPAPSPALRERGYSAGLYRMLAWLSPGFPVGAFSFSHGLESTAEGGSVRNRASLQDWICAVVASGSGRIDGDILRDAYRAAMADDIEALIFANQRGVAFRTTAEMAVETTAQGGAFLDTCRAASPLDRWAGALNGGSVCYAAAVGAATARAGIPVDCVLLGYLQAMAANLVSAGLRLGMSGKPMVTASFPEWYLSSVRQLSAR